VCGEESNNNKKMKSVLHTYRKLWEIGGKKGAPRKKTLLNWRVKKFSSILMSVMMKHNYGTMMNYLTIYLVRHLRWQIAGGREALKGVEGKKIMEIVRIFSFNSCDAEDLERSK
jgi:hypothetical protein